MFRRCSVVQDLPAPQNTFAHDQKMLAWTRCNFLSSRRTSKTSHGFGICGCSNLWTLSLHINCKGHPFLTFAPLWYLNFGLIQQEFSYNAFLPDPLNYIAMFWWPSNGCTQYVTCHFSNTHEGKKSRKTLIFFLVSLTKKDMQCAGYKWIMNLKEYPCPTVNKRKLFCLRLLDLDPFSHAAWGHNPIISI